MDDSIFVQNCGRLMAMSSAIVTMSHYEFHNICDTKLESIGQRIACYQEVGTWCPHSAYSVSAKFPLSEAVPDGLSRRAGHKWTSGTAVSRCRLGPQRISSPLWLGPRLW